MGGFNYFASLVPPAPKLAGISFNSGLGLKSFGEPLIFPGFFSPLVGGAGIYVLLAADSTWQPRQYRPLYFGETENFSQRVSTSHEHYGDWKRAAGSSLLYVAQLPMYGSTQQDRRLVEKALVDWYDPPVNKTCSYSGIAALGALFNTPPTANKVPPVPSWLTALGAPPSSPKSPPTLYSVLSNLQPRVPSQAMTLGKLMAPPKPKPARIFTSFDFDHDAALRMLLVNQAKHPDTPFEIHDWSVKEPLGGDWKEKVRQKIRQVDQVIVICGEYTDTAAGVDIEIKIAQELGKPYFLLKGYKDKFCTRPKAARPEDKIYVWSWENLGILIHGGR
ncbi:MAG TPA: TIR domain-containing protein [Bryobacteraceae bacterium]|jgi:hypothetical protein|nr:TIR domain-containing protein [Bryobacteraceae bacterium]